MRIKLTEHYQSMALQIAPGEYDINDPVLHGKGKYLVDTGHAVALGSDGREHTEDIAIALTMDELDNEDEPVIVEREEPAVTPAPKKGKR